MPHKLPSGSWRVRYRDKALGLMNSRTFLRRCEAEKFESEIKLGRAIYSENKPVTTFEAFAKRWHDEYCRVHKAPSQWREDASVIRLYLIPAFGQVYLRELKRSHLVTLQTMLAKEGRLAPKTINNVICLAKKIMADALLWEEVEGNPFVAVKRIRVPKQPYSFWTRIELDRFLSICKSRDFAMWQLVTVASNTGLRIGELQALQRDCVDFDARTITVRRIYVHKIKQEFETTKGKDYRIIEMNDAVMSALADKQLLAPTQKIFDFDIAMMARYRFKTMARNAGVKVLTIHGLRHTFATLLAMANVPPFELQAVLGHKDFATTTRYIHCAERSTRGITKVLDSLVPRAVPRNASNLRNVM